MTEQLRQWEDKDYREGVLRTAADSEIWAVLGTERRSIRRAVEMAQAIAAEDVRGNTCAGLAGGTRRAGQSDRNARGWIIRTRSSPNRPVSLNWTGADLLPRFEQWIAEAKGRVSKVKLPWVAGGTDMAVFGYGKEPLAGQLAGLLGEAAC